jgi:Flp pilus assembly protein TadD
VCSLSSEASGQAAHLFEAGNACYQAGRFAAAASYYRRVLGIAPNHPESHNNLGAALADLGQTDEAIACYLRALQLRPDYAEAHFNLGNAFRLSGYHAAAVSCYRRAVELQPGRPGFLNNLGLSLSKLGRLAEAEVCHRRALEIDPHDAQAWTNLGLVLADQGRVQDAVACHGEAIRLRPDYAEAHRNRSLSLLLLGDYGRGWDDYQWRWRCADFAYLRFSQPRWDGAALPGGTVLLHSEQGYGDTFQFIRYAPLVKRDVGRVVLATRRELIPILGRCAGIDQLVPLDAELPDFDAHCALMSLPRVFATTVETIPAEVPYVFADSQRVAAWRDELRSLSGLRVGLCWQGSSGNQYYREHGIRLACLAPLAGVENVQWISLQKGSGGERLADAPLPIVDLSSRLDVDGGAFEDTAAVIALLDLVIAFDTSVAHLAGAMGKPVWIALPSVPDWRWLLDRDDSPWYPTARLFRQPEPGNWDQPLRRMAEALGGRSPRA